MHDVEVEDGGVCRPPKKRKVTVVDDEDDFCTQVRQDAAKPTVDTSISFGIQGNLHILDGALKGFRYALESYR